MFARSRLQAVAAFTPPALPGFFAIPAAIPGQGPLLSFFSRLDQHTRRRSTSHAKNLSDQPGSFTFTVCCSMLSATPER